MKRIDFLDVYSHFSLIRLTFKCIILGILIDEIGKISKMSIRFLMLCSPSYSNEFDDEK